MYKVLVLSAGRVRPRPQAWHSLSPHRSHLIHFISSSREIIRYIPPSNLAAAAASVMMRNMLSSGHCTEMGYKMVPRLHEYRILARSGCGA